jgi:hypothetical protein
MGVFNRASTERMTLHNLDEGHSDSKRAFQELGIRTKGSLILIEAAQFEPMDLSSGYPAPGTHVSSLSALRRTYGCIQ